MFTWPAMKVILVPWKTLLDALLESTCAANRRAPAAAKRMGMAPPWPPNLPDAFGPLIQEAEKKNEGVVAADAVKNPALLKKSPQLPTAPAPPRRQPVPPAPPAKAIETGKTVAPPIKRSPFRRPIGSVVEVPTTVPAKPMSEVKGRAMGPAPTPGRPHIEAKEDAPLLSKSAPLPIAALPSKAVEQIKLDPRGRKVPRGDRWQDDDFEWELPTLPPSQLPPPMRAAVAPGPFTQRLQSLFDDRPEAVDRLCAAADARWAIKGEEAVLVELSNELSSKKWKNSKVPGEQLKRLRAIESDQRQPKPWRTVARFLLGLRPEA